MKGISLNLDSAVVLTILVATLCTVFCLDSEIPQELSHDGTGWPAPIEKYPRNYYELYHDLEAWKRAPSAGFYGMRGKKVPNSNFFGMRGKKGPSGFLGMRGKKMDVYSQIRSDLSPLDTYESVWTPQKPKGFADPGRTLYRGQDGFGDDILDESQLFGESRPNHRGPEEDTVLEHRVKRNIGQITI